MEARRKKNENDYAWFKRLVASYCEGDPTKVAVEQNIAMIGAFRWRNDSLVYTNLSVLVTIGCSLVDYYGGGADQPAVYLRLDVDEKTLGTPFSHPLAHVQLADDEAPRFALAGGNSGNVIMDFLEFVYLRYKPGDWVDWARRQWLSELDTQERQRQFTRILQAFEDSQFQLLRDNHRVISTVKSTLRKAKDSFFKSHLNAMDREILEYPAAR